MGTSSLLSETLFGRTRGAVLSILYGRVGKSFYLRQLPRLTDIALGPVQREIRQLVEAGLVSKKTIGTRTLYSANRQSPVFREVNGLVTQMVGKHDVLPEAIMGVRDGRNLPLV